MDSGEIRIRRSPGKLTNLEGILQTEPVKGTCGIGHTRWATHGIPTEQNAHPHRDCKGKIAVVHNGIIENYLELKQNLKAEKHVFTTDTDTEVIAHLVEKHYSGDLEKAVLAAFQVIRGVYACAIVHAAEPGKIVAVRNGPPLVVGVNGGGGCFLASDISAILEYTRDIVFLEASEISSITGSGVEIRNFHGQLISRSPHCVSWSAGRAGKDGFDHYMLKEIFEQPRAIRETIANRFTIDPPRLMLDDFHAAGQELASVRKINIVAAGTSWHAALVGKFMLEEYARVPVEVDISSEFRYRNPLISKKTLTLAITQSGETADTIAAVREAKELGSLTMSISNVLDSLITRETEGTLYTHAGPEIGVASTKAFTTQLVVLYLFTLYMAQKRKSLTSKQIAQGLRASSTISNLVEAILQKHEELRLLAERYGDCRDFLYLGRGIHYPIALEGALKLKEISYIHAEGYPAGEMKHGPIALIDQNMPVVALMPSDRHYEKIFSNVMEARARNGRIIAIATEGDTKINEITDDVFFMPDCSDPLLTPILSAIPLQLLAYYIAVRRNCDVDQPRNLAKSVTVE